MDFSQWERYIDARLKEEITLAEWGRVFGYSPWYLYKIFRRCAGVPIMEYIRKKRLLAAAQEFLYGDSLTDIAMAYGYDTQAGFYKAFLTEFGVSPSEYKNHLLREKNHRYTPKLQKIVEEERESMDPIRIRKIQRSDAKSLWQNLLTANTFAEVEERVADSLRRMDDHTQVQVVALADDQVIATLVLRKSSRKLAPHTGELYDELIVSEFKGLGVEKRMFQECCVFAKGCGISLIRGSQRECMAGYYRELGFTEAGRIPGAIIDPWGEHLHHDEILFYKTLIGQ